MKHIIPSVFSVNAFLVFFTSKNVKRKIREKNIRLVNYNEVTRALPRSTHEAAKVNRKKIAMYLEAVKKKHEDLLNYLYPRLFRPLGITGITWQESPQGIRTEGWELDITTEDMAKMGQFILQKGMRNGKQLIPMSWTEAMTTV